MSSINNPVDPRGSAIRKALASQLDNRQLAAAMQLWQEKYAGQTTFSVQYFVRECCALLDVKSLRNQMIQNLVMELNNQRMQLAETGQSVHVEAELHNSSALQVFQLLFREIVERAGSLYGWELTSYVASALAKIRLQDDAQKALDAWMNQSKPLGDVYIPVSAMTMLLNRAYIGLCEYCGPIKADQILHEAVIKVAATQQGKVFNPEKLL